MEEKKLIDEINEIKSNSDNISLDDYKSRIEQVNFKAWKVSESLITLEEWYPLGNVFNILITGYNHQQILTLAEILRDYGTQYPLIQKSVGTEFTEKFDDEECTQATIRYYIENRVYKLDKDYRLSEPLSPLIPKKDAHLVIGLDPIPVFANLDYITEKSLIVLNANSGSKKISKSVGEIVDLLDQLARITISMDFDKLANEVFGNLDMVIFILLGLIAKEFKELIRKNYLLKLLRSSKYDLKQLNEAFDLGYSLV